MPKKAVSEKERMDKELLVAIRAGQTRLGDQDIDTARSMPVSLSTYYSRKRDPEMFLLRELRNLAKRYKWTDYQASQILGVPYNGCTPVS